MPARTKTAPDDAPDDAPTDNPTESGDPTQTYRDRGWTYDAEKDEWYDVDGDPVPMIVHHERIIDSTGTQIIKTHGPMPRDDWPRYQQEHNL